MAQIGATTSYGKAQQFVDFLAYSQNIEKLCRTGTVDLSIGAC